MTDSATATPDTPITEDALYAELKRLYACRADEITAFWESCRRDLPEPGADVAPVQRELWLLAQACKHRMHYPTPPDEVAEAMKAALDARLEDRCFQMRRQWDDTKLVGVFERDGQTILVHRMSMGPFYHGEGEDIGEVRGEGWVIDAVGFEVSDGPDEEEFRGYTFGRMDDQLDWQPAALTQPQQMELEVLLNWTECLASFNRLRSNDDFYSPPLPAFPTAHDARIAELQAQRDKMFDGGRRPQAMRDALRTRTQALQDKLDDLYKQKRAIEDQIDATRNAIFEIDAGLLEEETGIKRGDTIVHITSGETGVVDITSNGGASYRIKGHPFTSIDGQIRRGEWRLATPQQP